MMIKGTTFKFGTVSTATPKTATWKTSSLFQYRPLKGEISRTRQLFTRNNYKSAFNARSQTMNNSNKIFKQYLFTSSSKNQAPTAYAPLQKKIEEKQKEGEKGDYTLSHPLWNNYEVNEVIVEKHLEPQNNIDKMAYILIKIMKTNFDIMSGFKFGTRTPSKWLNRIIFLETVAGVPGSIGGTLRHLASLRKMKRDHGWIHTLLEEAENERLHLLTALNLKNPSLLFRALVMVTQGIFYNFFFASYLISPKFCHRLVGYLEEEAVKTYTRCLADIDNPSNPTSAWATTPAPEIAKQYWHLKDNATMRDVILVIRADEAHHRDVNHTFGNMHSDDVNPFGLGR